MKASELREWLDAAAAAGAVTLCVRRSASFGKPGAVHARHTIEGLDAGSVVQRLHDDLEERRKGSGVFFLEAVNHDGEVVQVESLKVATGVDGPELVDGAGEGATDFQSLVRALVAQNDRLAKQNEALLTFTTANMRTTLEKAYELAEKVTGRMVEQDKAWSDLVSQTLEMSSLKAEREQAQQASEEKRAMIGAAFERGMPVFAALIAEWAKAGKGAKIAALLETLSTEQAASIMMTLTPEQRIAFDRIMAEDRPSSDAPPAAKHSNGAAS